MLKRLFSKRIKELHEKYVEEKVLIFDDMVNFFGLESLGTWKVRGNGVLILTKQELFFGMWKPKKEMIIPVKSITEITNPKSHLNKSVFKPLLQVIFKNAKGNNDSAAWFVQDLNKWNKKLNGLLLKKESEN
ncbi:MAG: hypothetical protein ACXAAH_04065 [Promethearchaeota archaeon]|jgi:hypothetical protein